MTIRNKHLPSDKTSIAYYVTKLIRTCHTHCDDYIRVRKHQIYERRNIPCVASDSPRVLSSADNKFGDTRNAGISQKCAAVAGHKGNA